MSVHMFGPWPCLPVDSDCGCAVAPPVARRKREQRVGRTLMPVPSEEPNMSQTLSDEEVEAQLPDDWHREGDEIVRTYEFDVYLDGVGFAAGAGGVAQDAFHHPEITISWREVEVRLTTHDAGGITEKDIDLAERFDDLR